MCHPTGRLSNPFLKSLSCILAKTKMDPQKEPWPLTRTIMWRSNAELEDLDNTIWMKTPMRSKIACTPSKISYFSFHREWKLDNYSFVNSVTDLSVTKKNTLFLDYWNKEEIYTGPKDGNRIQMFCINIVAVLNTEFPFLVFYHIPVILLNTRPWSLFLIILCLMFVIHTLTHNKNDAKMKYEWNSNTNSTSSNIDLMTRQKIPSKVVVLLLNKLQKQDQLLPPHLLLPLLVLLSAATTLTTIFHVRSWKISYYWRHY